MSEWRIFGACEFEDANAPKAAKHNKVRVCVRVCVSLRFDARAQRNNVRATIVFLRRFAC